MPGEEGARSVGFPGGTRDPETRVEGKVRTDENHRDHRDLVLRQTERQTDVDCKERENKKEGE